MSVQPLSPTELEGISALRNRITDIVPAEDLYNDYYLIRWLRAREMNLDNAEAMIRKSMAWSKRNEMEIVAKWKPVHNYFRFSRPGMCADGTPIFIVPIGLWDMKAACDMGDIVPAFRSILRILKLMEDEIKKAAKTTGKPISQLIVIFDFNQFQYRQITSRTVVQGAVEFFRVFEANFPEILSYCFFINTPVIFPIFWKFIKPFLSSRTLGKMQFYNTNVAKWREVILRVIPQEILPPYYGGTRAGSDEYCSNSGIWNDEPLPQNYYRCDMNKGRNSIYDLASTFVTASSRHRNESRSGPLFRKTALTLTSEIPAGDKVQFDFTVDQNQLNQNVILLIKWKINSEGYDIGFEVTFKEDKSDTGKKEEVLIPNHRISSHQNQVEGSIVCGKVGTYTVTLDNTYSKRTKKSVSHCIYLDEIENQRPRAASIEARQLKTRG